MHSIEPELITAFNRALFVGTSTSIFLFISSHPNSSQHQHQYGVQADPTRYIRQESEAVFDW